MLVPRSASPTTGNHTRGGPTRNDCAAALSFCRRTCSDDRAFKEWVCGKHRQIVLYRLMQSRSLAGATCCAVRPLFCIQSSRRGPEDGTGRSGQPVEGHIRGRAFILFDRPASWPPAQAAMHEMAGIAASEAGRNRQRDNALRVPGVWESRCDALTPRREQCMQ